MADAANDMQELERTNQSIEDVALMMKALNDIRSSVQHVFHMLQGRLEVVSGSEFHANAKYSYDALTILGRLALQSATLMQETQELVIPKGTAPSPVSFESKKRAAEEHCQHSDDKDLSILAKRQRQDQHTLLYTDLSADETLKVFEDRAQQEKLCIRVIKLHQEPGLPVVTFKIVAEHAFKAYLVFETDLTGHCISIVRLVLFGISEDKAVWEESNHLVFKKISQIAVGAIDYFLSSFPRAALGLVMEWLSLYRNLFVLPCTGCGQHLAFDSQQFKHLPPTLYTYSSSSLDNNQNSNINGDREGGGGNNGSSDKKDSKKNIHDELSVPYHPQCLAKQ